jgi:tetratricopeptide (TPR) repeat protein
MAADYARAAGDEGLRQKALGRYIGALRAGRTPAAEIAAELDAIEAGQPGPFLSARLDLVRGSVASFAGRFEEARLTMRRAGEQLDALGYRVQKAMVLQGLGRLELAAGNPSGARSALLESDAILADAGERGFRSTTQAFLGAAYEQLGERDAAVAAIELAESLVDEEDLGTLLITNSVRSRLALAENDVADAERWARSAVEYASRTDEIVAHGETKMDLARVLAVNRPYEAVAEAEGALALFDENGDLPNAVNARTLLDDLSR